MSNPNQLYDILIDRDVRIPMRDGIHLAANLYMPEGTAAGPVPAIVQYTPYLKDGRGGRGPIEIAQMYFARRGYACLNIDMRGYGCSEGVAAAPFSDSEVRDGVDALAWIAAQPWCSGRTGMWGISYGGDTALSVAAAQPPSLGAIVPIHAIDDEFTGVCYPHGCRGGHIGEVDWGFRMVGYQLMPPLRFDSRRRWERLWRERLEKIDPVPFSWHTIPPATWASWRADIEAIRAPAYAVSAWHDCYPAETLNYYNRLNVPKRALIGPWKHEFPDRGTHHPIGFWHEMTRWWDMWLKDIDTGIMDEPALRMYDQPEDGWRYDSAWPPPSTTPTDYFLQADGGLAATSPQADAYDTYQVNPTVGLNHLPTDWTTPTPPRPMDISPDDHRAITYTTAPYAADLNLRGEVELVLHVSADQPDFPLVAWLADVSPSGYSKLICEGWIRPTHVVGGLLQTGQVYELRVPLLPTSYRLPAGHRLRLAISGACFPMLISAPISPVLKIHRRHGSASRLRLPIAPARDEAQTRPKFQPPVSDEPEAVISSHGDYSIGRDLLERSAKYQTSQRAEYRLEAGTLLRTEYEAEVKLDSQNPRNVNLRGTQLIEIEREMGSPIQIQLETHETFDFLRISAEIQLDKRLFFRRAWELDLYRSEWAYRSI